MIRLLAVRYGAIEKPTQLTTVCTLAAGKLDRLDGRGNYWMFSPRRPQGKRQLCWVHREGSTGVFNHARDRLSSAITLVTCKARFRFTSCWEAAPLIHSGHDACFLSLRSEHSERLEG